MESAIQKRPRLSVAMIAGDEEDVLAESLDSIRPIADEIVVLDTCSTDRTAAIARQHGAAVGQMPWTDDFSAARNRCLEQVTGDWVLWLDAGERLDEESAAELRRFVDRQADRSNAYLMMIVVPPAEQGGSSEQVAQLRLMPNRPELHFEGRVRETAKPSVETAGMGIDAGPGRILRHPRHHDPARKAACARRNLKLVELEIAETDNTPPVRLRLAEGEAHDDLDAREEAQRAFRQAIEAAEHGSTEMLEAYYGLLATHQSGPFEPEVQMNACLEALEVFSFDAQLLLTMGNCLQAQKRIDLACRSFDLAVRHGQVNLQTWHLGELGEVAAGCLNLVLQLQGKDDQARGVLEEALENHPDSTRLRRYLIDLHVKHARCQPALDLVDQIAQRPEQREPLCDAVRGACQAAEQHWTAAMGYLQGAYVAGCRDPICLRWLSVTLLSNGQIDAALPVLNEWQQVEPANVEVQTYLAAIQQPQDVVPDERQASGQDRPKDLDRRQLRLDPGGTVLETTPRQLPIVSQNTSADSTAEFET